MSALSEIRLKQRKGRLFASLIMERKDSAADLCVFPRRSIAVKFTEYDSVVMRSTVSRVIALHD